MIIIGRCSYPSFLSAAKQCFAPSRGGLRHSDRRQHRDVPHDTTHYLFSHKPSRKMYRNLRTATGVNSADFPSTFWVPNFLFLTALRTRSDGFQRFGFAAVMVYR